MYLQGKRMMMKLPECPHPDLTHAELPFANCIPASDVPHFGPTDSAVIWLEMEALHVLSKAADWPFS